MLWVDEVTLFVFLRVDMTRQVHHIITLLIFYLLGVPRSFGLPFEFAPSHGQSLSRSSWLGFSLLLPTGVPSSGFMSSRFVVATPESVLFFTIGIFGGDLHHSTQGHVSGLTKLQTQLSVLNAFLEGTYFLVIG